VVRGAIVEVVEQNSRPATATVVVAATGEVRVDAEAVIGLGAHVHRLSPRGTIEGGDLLLRGEELLGTRSHVDDGGSGAVPPDVVVEVPVIVDVLLVEVGQQEKHPARAVQCSAGSLLADDRGYASNGPHAAREPPRLSRGFEGPDPAITGGDERAVGAIEKV